MSSQQTRQDLDTSLAAIRPDHDCFGCGDDHPIGLHLRFAVIDEGVRAEFTRRREHQGFQGVAHGGIISTVLDEAMAWATASAGFWAVTGEMRVKFRQSLRVGATTVVEARVTAVRGQTIVVAPNLTRIEDEATIATATATFVQIPDDVAVAWRARYLTDAATGPA